MLKKPSDKNSIESIATIVRSVGLWGVKN